MYCSLNNFKIKSKHCNIQHYLSPKLGPWKKKYFENAKYSHDESKNVLNIFLSIKTHNLKKNWLFSFNQYHNLSFNKYIKRVTWPGAASWKMNIVFVFWNTMTVLYCMSHEVDLKWHNAKQTCSMNPWLWSSWRWCVCTLQTHYFLYIFIHECCHRWKRIFVGFKWNW